MFELKCNSSAKATVDAFHITFLKVTFMISLHLYANHPLSRVKTKTRIKFCLNLIVSNTAQNCSSNDVFDAHYITLHSKGKKMTLNNVANKLRLTPPPLPPFSRRARQIRITVPFPSEHFSCSLKRWRKAHLKTLELPCVTHYNSNLSNFFILL